MADIKISDLHPAGSELFSDSEGYMNELDDGELSVIYGGIASWKKWVISATVVTIISVATGTPSTVTVTVTA